MVKVLKFQNIMSKTMVYMIRFYVISLVLASLDLSYAASEDKEASPDKKQDLKIEVIKAAPSECKRKSAKGDLISIKYTGYFENGTKFDSTADRPEAQPVTFQLGYGQAIQGWEQGLVDMCAGETRKLFIPSHMAFDQMGAGVIPPDTNLVYEAEMMEIADGPPPPNVFKMIDIDKDKFLTVDEVALYLSRHAVYQGLPDEVAVQHNRQQMDQLFTTDDKNNDGRVSYEEFSGPKVDPPHDEL